jgi:hypothetical protein
MGAEFDNKVTQNMLVGQNVWMAKTKTDDPLQRILGIAHPLKALLREADENALEVSAEDRIKGLVTIYEIFDLIVNVLVAGIQATIKKRHQFTTGGGKKRGSVSVDLEYFKIGAVLRRIPLASERPINNCVEDNTIILWSCIGNLRKFSLSIGRSTGIRPSKKIEEAWGLNTQSCGKVTIKKKIFNGNFLAFHKPSDERIGWNTRPTHRNHPSKGFGLTAGNLSLTSIR